MSKRTEASEEKGRLLPEFVYNILATANSGSRVIRKAVESGERFVDGCDELITIGMSGHAERLRKQLGQPATKTITVK